MDIMYITRKSFSDNVQQRVTVEGFVAAFKLLKISKKDRNIKDFVNSPVKAVTPEDFLNIY